MPLDTSTDPQVGFRPPGALDVTNALVRYEGPFGIRAAAHLARRTGFGAAPSEVADLEQRGMEGAVNARMHPTGSPAFPDYPASDVLYDLKKRYYVTQMWWYDRLVRTPNPFAEKIALFWHGHFATSMQKVPPQMMARQINLFRAAGMGDFRTLLLSVSQDPAMLVWLDNRFNYKTHPNENYARELMELFSLGLGNYTEDDVKAAARALTGWTLDRSGEFVVRAALHDTGVKTFLGQTGNFDGRDIVGIIVSKPEHQRFLMHKVLEFFLYSDPEPTLIEKLSEVYALSGFNIGQTLGTLLRSNVFYSERAYRAIPKSPVEFAVGLLRFFGAAKAPPTLPGAVARMGQNLLYPPNVKGWDGGPTWINTTTMLARFNFVNAMVQNRQTGATTTPDYVLDQAGGFNADRVVDWIAGSSLQNDLTSEMRFMLLQYIDAANAPLPTAFGRENYDARIRGTLALALNLPADQLN